MTGPLALAPLTATQYYFLMMPSKKRSYSSRLRSVGAVHGLDWLRGHYLLQ